MAKDEEIRALYNIPYNKLTPEQKKLLKEDAKRRADAIDEITGKTRDNNTISWAQEMEYEKELIALYEDSLDKLIASVTKTIAKVQKNGGEWSYAYQSELTRSRGLYEQIEKILEELTGKEYESFYDYLSHIYTDQFLRELYTIGEHIEVSANFNRISAGMVKQAIEYPWSGSMFSSRLWLDKQRLIQAVRTNITQSMILGESIYQISDRLSKQMETSLYNAERIARTETKRVCYIAHDAVMEECKVKQVRYLCANGGDERVCKFCIQDNRKIFTRGEEPTLPRHPNCRCWYVPVVSDTFDMSGIGELNELTGSIRGAKNYVKWMKANADKLNPDGTFKAGWVRDWRKGENFGKLIQIDPNEDPKKYGIKLKIKSQEA